MSRTHPYLAEGLDYQGRYPEAASACTEIGAEDDDRREDMTAADVWQLVAIYVASVLISVQVFHWIAGMFAR